LFTAAAIQPILKSLLTDNGQGMFGSGSKSSSSTAAADGQMTTGNFSRTGVSTTSKIIAGVIIVLVAAVVVKGCK